MIHLCQPTCNHNKFSISALIVKHGAIVVETFVLNALLHSPSVGRKIKGFNLAEISKGLKNNVIDIDIRWSTYFVP